MSEQTHKITLRGHIDVPDTDLQAVIAELPTHIQLTRDEPGCIVFQVVQDTASPNRFTVYEEFSDREAFDQHQSRLQSSHWGELTANVKRTYAISCE